MAELITVPVFIFNQGELLIDTDAEFPIRVEYYTDGMIALVQDERSISVRYKDLKRLVKEIERHFPEAERSLKNRK